MNLSNKRVTTFSDISLGTIFTQGANLLPCMKIDSSMVYYFVSKNVIDCEPDKPINHFIELDAEFTQAK